MAVQGVEIQTAAKHLAKHLKIENLSTSNGGFW
jgi:hypothetical protein